MNTTVFRGDQVLRDYFPATVEAQAREYGVSWIVVAPSYGPRPDLDALVESPTPSMVVAWEVPVHSTYPEWSSRIRIYKLLNPSPTPKMPPLRTSIMNLVIKDPDEW
jgi:hypothetical protein